MTRRKLPADGIPVLRSRGQPREISKSWQTLDHLLIFFYLVSVSVSVPGAFLWRLARAV